MAKTTPSVVKFSVFLPPEVHRAAKIDAASRSESLSSVISEIVAERFRPGNRDELTFLAQPDVRKDSDWIRATVFLSATLKDRATKEVQRQTKPGQDGRKKGSLASAIAALVSAKYSG